VPDRVASTDDPGLEALLEHLKQARAFDFTGYKRATLSRRIEKRMQQVGVERHEDYVDFLQVHPEEFEQLFNTILINVTGFFRDAEMWRALRETVVPELVERDEIRVWSAGSASGEEAYSVAMLFADVLGVEDAKKRLKVYATDVDSAALDDARHAVYAGRQLEGLPEGYLDRYFEPAARGHTFSGDLRRTVIFGRHDLLVDAPISRVDLLLCRNTLMYFNADVQTTLVHRLHFALNDGGFLTLGKVEMLLGKQGLFEPVDMKQRIFRKVSRVPLRSRLLAMAGSTGVDGGVADPVLESAFEHAPGAQLLLDGTSRLAAANAQARATFGLAAESIGRPFQDLEVSYRPVELRSWIDQAVDEQRPVQLRDVERWAADGEQTFLDIVVVPLGDDGRHGGVLITFVDVTAARRVQDELEQTHRELETAYEELQSANEELETTNEELQSTIEELETTNEELQSTNEELETMNEELASTNEELQAINDELRDRTNELDEASAYIDSIMGSLSASVVVVDAKLSVRLWNGRSYDLWGLRREEVEGRDLASLDTGFPFHELVGAIRGCIDGGACEPQEVEALTRRGVRSTMRVQISTLRSSAGAPDGAILLIEETAAPD
jgi:two-component system, chemotaxis family, CheB/CheR fusion protein